MILYNLKSSILYSIILYSIIKLFLSITKILILIIISNLHHLINISGIKITKKIKIKYRNNY